MGEQQQMTPEVKRLIARTFPGYRGRRVYAEVRQSTTFYGTLWSGGTCNEYGVYDMRTGRIEYVSPEHYMGGDEFYRKAQPIEAGTIVVKNVIGNYKYVQFMGSAEDLAACGLHVAVPV